MVNHALKRQILFGTFRKYLPRQIILFTVLVFAIHHTGFYSGTVWSFILSATASFYWPFMVYANYDGYRGEISNQRSDG